MSRTYPAVYWPTDQASVDPFAEDPWPGEDPQGRAALDAVRTGEIDTLPPRWLARATASVPAPPPERPAGDLLASVIDLVRIAIDYAPAAGHDAPHRVLGPWALDLDPDLPGHQRAWLHAAAALAFTPLSPKRASPAVQYARRSKSNKATAAVRHSVRVVGWAPMSLWEIGLAEGGGHWLVDRVGLDPRQLPDGPVHLGDLGLMAGEVGPGDTLLARVARDAYGWRAVVALGLPGRPSDALVARWLSWVVLERRLRSPTLPRPVVLRRWGWELCRYAHEWAWLRTREP